MTQLSTRLRPSSIQAQIHALELELLQELSALEEKKAQSIAEQNLNIFFTQK